MNWGDIKYHCLCYELNQNYMNIHVNQKVEIKLKMAVIKMIQTEL